MCANARARQAEVAACQQPSCDWHCSVSRMPTSSQAHQQQCRASILQRLPPLLVLLLAGGAGRRQGRATTALTAAQSVLHAYPFQPNHEVTTVHVVSSAHLDVGYKYPYIAQVLSEWFEHLIPASSVLSLDVPVVKVGAGNASLDASAPPMEGLNPAPAPNDVQPVLANGFAFSILNSLWTKTSVPFGSRTWALLTNCTSHRAS